MSGTAITLNSVTIPASGPISGTIDGDTATLTATLADGVFTFVLVLDGDTFTGTASRTYTSGECSGSEIGLEFDGVRLPSPCESAGGPFTGYWNVALQATENNCEILPSASQTCVELYQHGNLVFDVDRDGGALVASFSGRCRRAS